MQAVGSALLDPVSAARAAARTASVTVIIPASRPERLSRCLESLCRCLGPGPGEVLVVLNDGGDACGSAARRFAGRLPGLKILPGARVSPGAARNRALAAARGEWLCFLDDDVAVPAHYFRVLAEKIARHPAASVIGGPNLTPPGRPLFERCVGHLLGSWLGAGGTGRRFRGYARDSWCDERGLILCNLCVRRGALAAAGLRFDESLPRNEENLLLEKLARRGHAALHSPTVYVYHDRRSTLLSFARQCYLSGWGRAGMSRRMPSSLRPIYLLPGALALGVLAAPFHPAALGALAVYGAAALGNALWLTVERKETLGAVLWLWVLHPVTHLSYAGGFVRGLAGP